MGGIAYKPSVVLVDGHNLFIRNFVVNPTMDRDGRPCGGIVGMLQSIRRLVIDMKPTALIVVWDGEGGSERRRSIRKEYKEGRKVRLNREYDFDTTAGQDLHNLQDQVLATVRYLDLLGVRQVRAAGVEADDMIAYLCGLFEGAMRTVVSTDRDLLQLVREDVAVYNPAKKRMLRAAEVLADVGCLPSNYSCMKAICGDRGDDVSGVSGVGPKTLMKIVPEMATQEDMGLGVILDLIEERAEVDTGKKSKTGLSRHAVDIVNARDHIEENMTLVSLRDPMVSPEAARAARSAVRDAREFRPLSVRTEMVRDGVTLNEDFDKQFMMLASRTALWLRSLAAEASVVNEEAHGG